MSSAIREKDSKRRRFIGKANTPKAEPNAEKSQGGEGVKSEMTDYSETESHRDGFFPVEKSLEETIMFHSSLVFLIQKISRATHFKDSKRKLSYRGMGLKILYYCITH